MAYYNIYDGIISSGLTLSYLDYMYISSGGTANSTTVSSGGTMCISSGGTANSTTVNSSGYMFIYSGGTANSTTVNSWGSMFIYCGGVANSTTINSGGEMYISSGGTANSTTVNYRGNMYIDSGGTANSSFVTNDGHLHISSGGIANHTILNEGSLVVSKGGIASDTRVMYDSWITVYGAVYNTEMTARKEYYESAVLRISNGGYANSTFVNNGCFMYVDSKSIAENTVVNSQGSMHVLSSGEALSTTINKWGYASVYCNGKISGTIVNNLGSLSIDSSTAIDTVINSGGRMTQDDGYAEGTTINNGGKFTIYSAVAANTAVNSGGSFCIGNKAYASNTRIDIGGFMCISSGGTALDTTVSSGGKIYLLSGGTATNIIAESGAELSIDVATNTYISGTFAGSSFEMTNAYISGYTIYSSGVMWVTSGGTAEGTTITSRAHMYLSGGIGNNNIVDYGGQMNIYSGGKVADTTVNRYGYMYIETDGLASNTVINSNGRMYIYGIHDGTLQIESGATVSAYSGAKIDFTVADRNTEDGFLINDLSLIQGAPTYTITVSADQADGTYKLAQGASNVTNTLTIGDGTVNYGSITVNGENFVYNDKIYSLDQVDGNLTLTINTPDITPPTLTITGNATTPTNQDVVLKISANENCTILYNIDNGEWLTYSGGITVTANGTVNIKATDEAGNVTEKSVMVDMIDKIAPTIEISGNAEVPTNQDVILTATVSDGIVEYWDGAEWIEGNSITATENGIYQFRVTDAAGNVTEKSVTVDMIDKIAPTLEISGNAEVATNQDVILTATASDGIVEYWDGAEWITGNTITATTNGTYQFRVTDAAGNVTEKSVTVDMIDKVAPTLEITGNATEPTNKDVVLTATVSDGIVEYWDGAKWIEGNKLTVISNGTYQFRVTDAAGNVTEKSVTVDMIDKVAPTLEITSNATEPTNKDVVLTATVSDGTVEYFNGKDWVEGNSITATENGIYQFRVTDAAGNVTEKSVTVDMIDKIAPDKPAVKADITGETTGAVTVSAIFSNDSVITEFSLDNKTWQTYTDGVVMESNGTVYFRGIDAAGNVSQVAVYEVNNIIAAPDVIDGDLDGNGLADVILVHTKQGYSGAWLTTGDASVIKWGSLSDVKSGIEILGTGTLYGSGNDGQDIFFADSKSVGAWNVVDGKVTGYKSVMSINSTTNVLGLGDFNGDGATDILLRSTNGDLGFYGTDGTGWEYLIGLGTEWKIAAVGDLDGDGTDDVIVRHDAGFAGTFLTQENGTVKWANLDTLSNDMTIVGTGDFNGDGVDDVLLQKADGWVGAWLVEDGSVDGFMGICKNKNSIEQIADFNGDGVDDLRIRAGADIGVLYVNGADDTTWQYFKSVGKEWDTSFALIS